MLSLKITTPAASMGLPARILADKRAAMERGTKRGAQWLLGALREQSLHGALHGRTGTLARSWAAGTAVTSSLGVNMVVGSKLAYAAIHEDDGEIRPVKARALTIPFAANIEGRERGPKYPTVAILKAAMGSKNVFTLKEKGKEGMIFAKTGKTDRSIKPYFLLRSSVKIPASHYVSIAVAAAGPLVTKEIKDALNEPSK